MSGMRRTEVARAGVKSTEQRILPPLLQVKELQIAA